MQCVFTQPVVYKSPKVFCRLYPSAHPGQVTADGSVVALTGTALGHEQAKSCVGVHMRCVAVCYLLLGTVAA